MGKFLLKQASLSRESVSLKTDFFMRISFFNMDQDLHNTYFRLNFVTCLILGLVGFLLISDGLKTLSQMLSQKNGPLL